LHSGIVFGGKAIGISIASCTRQTIRAINAHAYGLTYGTPAYADCREKLLAQQRSPEPMLGVVVAPK
jgi:hypothetical protein